MQRRLSAILLLTCVAALITPGAAPLHFTIGDYTLAPFFVADPSAAGPAERALGQGR